jgi:DNA-binding CsgD family transcriptional regulator
MTGIADLEAAVLGGAIDAAATGDREAWKAAADLPVEAFTVDDFRVLWADLLASDGTTSPAALVSRHPAHESTLRDLANGGQAMALAHDVEALRSAMLERKARDRLQAVVAEIQAGRPAVEALADLAADAAPMAVKRRLRPLPVADFLSMRLPRRDLILSPWLPRPGLAMIYAPRGLGKTWFASNVAWAAATGGRFLRWQAERPCKVLIVDGEMPADDLQRRFESIRQASGLEAIPDTLRILPAALEETGLPDLGTAEGRAALDACIGDAELVILDNLSTLLRSGRENEADDWGGFQGWLLDQRRQGRTILLVHHAAKGGQQRGTSRREDALDVVVALRKPDDYSPDQGARFEVHFEKARHFSGPDARPFEASMDPSGSWRDTDLSTDREGDRLAALAASGMTQRAIADEMGLSLGKVNKRLKSLRDQPAGDVHVFTPLREMNA